MTDHTDINLAVCEALGINPDDVTEIDLNFSAMNYPTVTIHRHIVEPNGELIETLSRFELRPKDEQ